MPETTRSKSELHTSTDWLAASLKVKEAKRLGDSGDKMHVDEFRKSIGLEDLVREEIGKMGVPIDDPRVITKLSKITGIPIKGVPDIDDLMTMVEALLLKDRRFFTYVTGAGTLEVGTTEIVKKAKPRIMFVETYALTSYLGDYGAGKTVRTFSLLPGEKTKISVKTWKSTEITSKQASSVLDSWTNETSDSFENTVQSESTEKTELTKTTEFSAQTTGEGHFNVAVWGVSGTHAISYKENWTDSRENFAKNVSSATQKHVSNASSKRNIEVNTSVESKMVSGEEHLIERMLENVNAGRVLNFVFRQLNQEYITYLHLVDVKLAFTNELKGSANYYTEFPLSDLEDFLSTYVKATGKDEANNTVNPQDKVRELIINELANIYDYKGAKREFIECINKTTGQTAQLSDYLDPNERLDDGRVMLYLRVKRTPFYQNAFSTEANYEKHMVEGVIMAKNRYILPTDSIIVEALLGQAEALDKYSIESRKAVIDMKRTEIDKMNLANAIVKSGDSTKAEVFGKVYPVPIKLIKASSPLEGDS